MTETDDDRDDRLRLMDGPLEPLTLEDLKSGAEAICAMPRGFIGDVDAMAARIMRVAKETGADPRAVARVLLDHPDPRLEVVVPVPLMDGPHGGCDLWPRRAPVFAAKIDAERLELLSSYMVTFGDIVIGDEEEYGVQIGWSCND